MIFVHVCYTRLSVILGLFAFLLTVSAPVIVATLAPGLAQQHHSSAVCMLQLMCPVVLLSGTTVVWMVDIRSMLVQSLCAIRLDHVHQVYVDRTSAFYISGWIGVSIGALVFMGRTLVPSALSIVGNIAFICLVMYDQHLDGMLDHLLAGFVHGLHVLFGSDSNRYQNLTLYWPGHASSSLSCCSLFV